MIRAKMALLYGAVGFGMAFPVLIIGSYIICFLDEVDYNWPIALTRGVKGSAFMGAVWAALQYIAGGIPQDTEPKR